MEHAIATLIGKPPSEVAIEAAALTTIIPVVPAGVPSTLLERRPDIASSEYGMAEANAQIGVAIAAWYPDLTLTGSYGFASSSLGSLFTAPNSVWSLGPSLAQLIFDGGVRAAQTDQARARYEQTVATYRQTVLGAFQQVEDQLSTLKVLEQQAVVENLTVSDARQSEQLALNQYRAGTADFTTVITAQTTRLNAEDTALSVLNQRLAASVNFVVALGGGWDASRVPQPEFLYRLPEITANDGPAPAPTPACLQTP
jgi:NodT family efflux transporter outer membrane factor (OMF) lipoprotein